MKEYDYSPEMIQLFQNVDKLPSLPEVATSILRLINDPYSSAKDIGKILKRDPATASQLLKLVNSAFYGLNQRITNLDQAISLVGFNRIRDLALSNSFFRIFNVQSLTDVFDVKEFWKYCVVNAGLCREIDKFTDTEDHTEVLYVIGLLHDIGILPLLEYCPEKMRSALKDARETQVDFREAERNSIGFTHYQAGAWLTQNWKLPETIADVIMKLDAGEKTYITAAVRVAECISSKIGVSPIYKQEMKLSRETWDVLKLDENEIFTLHELAERELSFAEIILMD